MSVVSYDPHSRLLSKSDAWINVAGECPARRTAHALGITLIETFAGNADGAARAQKRHRRHRSASRHCRCIGGMTAVRANEGL
jgi:hypothetical protein